MQYIITEIQIFAIRAFWVGSTLKLKDSFS